MALAWWARCRRHGPACVRVGNDVGWGGAQQGEGNDRASSEANEDHAERRMAHGAEVNAAADALADSLTSRSDLLPVPSTNSCFCRRAPCRDPWPASTLAWEHCTSGCASGHLGWGFMQAAGLENEPLDSSGQMTLSVGRHVHHARPWRVP